MKKSWIGLVFVSAVLLFSMIGFASAADLSETITNAINSITDVLNPVLRLTLGDVGSSANASDIFTIKVLLFVLMLSIAYFAVAKVPGIGQNTIVLWIVSIIVAVLGARMLSSSALIELLWLPSGLLAISITALLPLLIFFFFIESFEIKVVRTFGWALFGLMYLLLTAVRWEDLSAEVIVGATSFNLALIYLGAAVLALLFFIFDGTIQIWFAKARILKAVPKKDLEIEIRRKMVALTDDYTRKIITEKEYDEMRKDLQRRLAGLQKI